MSENGPESFGSLSIDRTAEDRTEQIKRLYRKSKNRGWWRGPDLQRIANQLDVSEAKFRRQLVDIYFPGWGSTRVTKRGEVVRSDLERQVADFFYREGIEYVYEPDIIGRYIPDFILGDGIAVEMWGVTENSDYDQNRVRKVKWYMKSPWGLVNLEPSDVDRLDEIFPIESREEDIVEYSSEGQATFWGTSSTSLSPSSSEGVPTPQGTSERIGYENSRQVMLDGRPKQAIVSDFDADGPWWETEDVFSQLNSD